MFRSGLNQCASSLRTRQESKHEPTLLALLLVTLVLILCSCGESPSPAATATPIIIVVTATPEPASSTSTVETLSMATEGIISNDATALPSTTSPVHPTSTPIQATPTTVTVATPYDSGEFAISTLLPGDQWKSPQPAYRLPDLGPSTQDLPQSGQHVETQGGLIVFEHTAEVGSTDTEYLKSVARTYLANNQGVVPGTIDVTTFNGYPAVHSEGKAQLGQNYYTSRYILYVFAAQGCNFLIYTSAPDSDWDKAGGPIVDFILNHVKVDPSQFIQRPTPTPIMNDGVVNDSDVRFRSGPGVNYPVIGKLDKGTSIGIHGKDASGAWLQIETWIPDSDGHGSAWMMRKYVQPKINLDSLPVVAAPPTPTAQPTVPPTATPVLLGGKYPMYSGTGGSVFVFAAREEDRRQIGIYRAQAGIKYVVIWVAVQNRIARNLYVNPLDIRLVSDEGISVSYDLATYGLPDGTQFQSVQLEQDAMNDGYLIFKVRNDFQPVKLVYEGLFETVEVPLK